jgi:hypothetical protein
MVMLGFGAQTFIINVHIIIFFSLFLEKFRNTYLLILYPKIPHVPRTLHQVGRISAGAGEGGEKFGQIRERETHVKEGGNRETN